MENRKMIVMSLSPEDDDLYKKYLVEYNNAMKNGLIKIQSAYNEMANDCWLIYGKYREVLDKVYANVDSGNYKEVNSDENKQ